MPYSDVLEQNLSKEARHNVEAWLAEPKYAEYHDELVAMIEAKKWQELEDGFFKVLEFGTAGRRGTTGLGSNRVNHITIGESAQALCLYAKSFDEDAANKGVVIAYDTRLSSPDLSRFAAQVCAANGFKTYLFDSFRSTPELSFAVRTLGTAVGIVISASHNPPADNGFKAYWSDGAQLVAPHDKGVLALAEGIKEIHTIDFDEAVAAGMIQFIGEAIDKEYLAAVVNQAEGTERDIKIVYSPLHGAGQTNTLPALYNAGFKDISVVEAQMVPDGHFPTVAGGKSNPEDKIANELPVKQMLSEGADIAITNDPDADRIGIMVRQGEDVIYLTGNQSGILTADYALRKLREKGTLTNKHYLVKTIVTTDMLNAIAKKYGVIIYDNLLVGFKYIGEVIRKKEIQGETFVTGTEESFGLLKGDYARDKDGATGALPMAEYAAELKKEGKTLYDRLNELYSEHGFYIERIDNVYFQGATGFEKMQEVMSSLRTTEPASLLDHTVTAVLDYQTLERRDTTTGNITTIDCISGNVIVFEFDGDKRRRITIRPSGTEPKLKFYVQWFEEAKSLEQVEEEHKKIDELLEQLSKALEDLLLK